MKTTLILAFCALLLQFGHAKPFEGYQDYQGYPLMYRAKVGPDFSK